MRNLYRFTLIAFILLFATPVVESYSYELTTTTDKKISTSVSNIILDSFEDTYAFFMGNERNELENLIQNNRAFYLGFDLNNDILFDYSEISLLEQNPIQKYTIDTLNVEIKLKDDHYNLYGLDLGDDIPQEFGNVEIQLWTSNDKEWVALWGGDPDIILNDLKSLYYSEINDPTIRFFYDFSTRNFINYSSSDGTMRRSMDWLDYDDWFNRGEIIVTAGSPDFLANSDFIVDSVKIWGERTEYFQEEPNPVPEPSTFLLLGGGLAGLAFVVRRRKKELF